MCLLSMLTTPASLPSATAQTPLSRPSTARSSPARARCAPAGCTPQCSLFVGWICLRLGAQAKLSESLRGFARRNSPTRELLPFLCFAGWVCSAIPWRPAQRTVMEMSYKRNSWGQGSASTHAPRDSALEQGAASTTPVIRLGEAVPHICILTRLRKTRLSFQSDWPTDIFH